MKAKTKKELTELINAYITVDLGERQLSSMVESILSYIEGKEFETQRQLYNVTARLVGKLSIATTGLERIDKIDPHQANLCMSIAGNVLKKMNEHDANFKDL